MKNISQLGRLRFIVVALLLSLVVPTAYAQTTATQFTGDSWSQFEGGAVAVCADDDVDNGACFSKY